MSTKKQVIMSLLSCLPWILVVSSVRAERMDADGRDFETIVDISTRGPTWVNGYSLDMFIGLAVDKGGETYKYNSSPAEQCVTLRSTYNYSNSGSGLGPSKFGYMNSKEIPNPNNLTEKPLSARVVLESGCSEDYKVYVLVAVATSGAWFWASRAFSEEITIPAKRRCYADVNNNISFGQVKANSGEHLKRITNSVGTSGNASGKVTFLAVNNNLQSGRNFIYYDLTKDTQGLVRENNSKWSGPLDSDYYLKLRNFDSSVPAGNYTGNLTVTLSCD